MSNFKKKLTKREFNVLIYDLDCLELKATEDNIYHYDLLVKNLRDLAGVVE